MKQKNRSGFTLIEVLTVIAIIAILAALILGMAGNAQKTAARKKAEAEISQLQSFVTDYQMKYGQVPLSTAALTNALGQANHPLATFQDPWGMPYKYTNSSLVTFYLWSWGGDLSTPPTERAMWIGAAP